MTDISLFLLWVTSNTPLAWHFQLGPPEWQQEPRSPWSNMIPVHLPTIGARRVTLFGILLPHELPSRSGVWKLCWNLLPKLAWNLSRTIASGAYADTVDTPAASAVFCPKPSQGEWQKFDLWRHVAFCPWCGWNAMPCAGVGIPNWWVPWLEITLCDFITWWCLCKVVHP